MMADVHSEPPIKKRRDESKCVFCNTIIRKDSGRMKAIETREDAKSFTNTYILYVQVGDKMCSKCFSKVRKNKSIKNKNKNQTELSEEETLPSTYVQGIGQESSEQVEDLHYIEQETNSYIPPTHSQPDSQISQTSITSGTSTDVSLYVPSPKKKTVPIIEMPFSRVIITRSYCFICKSKDDLHDISFEARMQAFVKKRIFIPKRNKICSKHIIKKRFYEEELNLLRIYSPECSVELTELEKFLDELSNKVDTRLHEKIAEYAISEERMHALTGHSWDDIIILRSMMTSMRDSDNRNVTQALVIFLFKLRTGNSDKVIAAVLGIDEKRVSDSIHAVLKCFKNDVLPSKFGINVHSREFFISQTSPVARMLHDFGDSLAIICDGTYLRHGKSANNIYQRKSYSLQKKTSLCKPFTVCTTNGYIVDVFGPFNANQNDAAILQKLLNETHGLSSILKEGDIFILDRGFRDIKEALENKGFKVLMPALRGKRAQLTTEESNESRLVTKIRWVVEAIHGCIAQKYKLLHNQLHNSLLPNAALFCQIACLLVNLMGKRMNLENNRTTDIVHQMTFTKDKVNTLAQTVERENYNRKTLPFKEINSSDIPDFPEVTLQDLEILFTGTYQLSQSVSYLAEMLDEDDTLRFGCLKAEPGIIRCDVKSRHINKKTYKCYIHYDSEDAGITAIKGYCCNCANGLRTVGCCSHVAAIIYYLSYGRYLSRVIRPAELLANIFEYTSVESVIDEDSDED